MRYAHKTLQLQGSQHEVQLFDFACSCRSTTSFVANKGLFESTESAGRPLGDIASSRPTAPGYQPATVSEHEQTRLAETKRISMQHEAAV